MEKKKEKKNRGRKEEIIRKQWGKRVKEGMRERERESQRYSKKMEKLSCCFLLLLKLAILY